MPLYIIYSLIVFAPLARGSVHPWAVTIIQTGVILAAIFLIAKNFRQNHGGKKILFPDTPMNKPIAAIIVLCTVSFAFSEHKSFAIEGLFMLFIYITAYFTVQSGIKTRKQQRILIYVIISTAVLLSVIGILKRFGLYHLFPWWIYPDVGGITHTANSITGTYVNRNHMAGFLEMAIPMLLILFITRQRSSETKSGMIFLAILLITTQAFTLSRGGWISTINAILFIAAVLLIQKDHVHKKIILTIGTGIVIISIFILASLPVVERITTLTHHDPSDNITGRMRAWKGSVNQIQDNLFTGTGPNTFREAYPEYQIPGNAVLRRYAHNDYLHFTVETGILFIPVLIYTLFCFFRSGFQKIKSRSRQQRGLALGAMAGVFAILIHSFSDFNLNIPANALIFTIIAGMVAKSSQYKLTPAQN